MNHIFISFPHLWEFVAILGATLLVHLLVTRDRKPLRPALAGRRILHYPVVGAAAVMGILLLTAVARDRFFVGEAARDSNVLVTAGAFTLWALFVAAWLRLRTRLRQPKGS